MQLTMLRQIENKFKEDKGLQMDIGRLSEWVKWYKIKCYVGKYEIIPFWQEKKRCILSKW